MIGRLQDFLRAAIRNGEEALVSPAAGRRKVLVVCVTGALCLTFAYYVAKPLGFFAFNNSLGNENSLKLWIDDHRALAPLIWWAGWTIFFYAIVPAVFVRFIFREKLADYGLRMRGAFTDTPLYLALLAVVLPLVWLLSSTAAFQAMYPFYKPPNTTALWPQFWIWEALYLMQFAALEFFFRGFLLHGTKPRFGFEAVIVMAIPYCMIHFGKPFPETCGAIVAGLVLGTLSLKSGSVVPGFCLHCGVAFSMDMAALWRMTTR